MRADSRSLCFTCRGRFIYRYRNRLFYNQGIVFRAACSCYSGSAVLAACCSCHVSCTTIRAYYFTVFLFRPGFWRGLGIRLRGRFRLWGRFRRNRFAIIDWRTTESTERSIFLQCRFAFRTDYLICGSWSRYRGDRVWRRLGCRSWNLAISRRFFVLRYVSCGHGQNNCGKTCHFV